MSVLVEAISVVARRSTIEEKYPGGLSAFEKDCPNQSYCSDDHLVRVGFMTPPDVEGFARVLASMGLVHLRDGVAADFVVIDQIHGPTTRCEWVDAGRHPDGYSAAWLAGTIPGWFAVPKGWKIGQSKNLQFVSSSDASERLVGLSRKDGLEVVLDLESGREGFIGRVPPPGADEPAS